MSKLRIGVTGVGGGAGQSVLKALQNTEYEVVGLDGELLGTGLYVTPLAYKIPYANSPEFIPALLDICRKERIQILFPGLDAELAQLSAHRKDFSAIGTTVIVSDASVIDISDNKLETFNQLTRLGFQVPATMTLKDFVLQREAIAFPIIVKQQVGGARSKNVFLFKTAALFETFLEELTNQVGYVVQEYIEGDEYTCGSVNLAGECKGVVVMRRILRDGDTYKCFSERNATIENAVTDLLNAIKPFGACNVQLRMRNGVPYIFEINARCSGTTAARALCGFNEPKAIADYLLKGIAPSFNVQPRTILRYWKELVVDEGLIEQVRNTGHVTSNEIRTL